MWVALAALTASSTTWADGPAAPGEPPRFKPSEKSPAPVDITTDDYGAFASAPNAPHVGDVIPDFSLPRARGGQFRLSEELKKGQVLLIFYRGHW